MTGGFIGRDFQIEVGLGGNYAAYGIAGIGSDGAGNGGGVCRRAARGMECGGKRIRRRTAGAERAQVHKRGN